MISTKAGYDMWPGPYGQGGGSRKYVLASLDQSLARMGLDYVDIFYSHRFDPETPVEETMMALDHGGPLRARRCTPASRPTPPTKTQEAATIARELGTPLLIHQPSYSMLNRWIEKDLLDELEEQGMGCIVFTALAQGLLTDRYLDGVPEDSRAARADSTLGREPPRRGDPAARAPAQRDRRGRAARSSPSSRCSGRCATRGSPPRSSAPPRSSSSTPTSTRSTGPPLTDEELAAIDEDAVEAGINLWAGVDRGLSPVRRPLRRPGRSTLFGEAPGAIDEAAWTKYVYDFSEGSKDQKDLLGGKGANLAEMTQPRAAGAAGVHDQHRRLPGLPRARATSPTGSPTRSSEHLAALEKADGPAARRSPTTRCWSRCAPGRSSRCPG